MHVGVYVCIRTHTHCNTLYVGCLDVRPEVGMRHLQGLKNPDGLDLSISVLVYVYKAHMSIYMLGDWMRSWATCFLSFNIFFDLKK